MFFSMYTTEPAKPGQFVIADADGQLVLRTANEGHAFCPIVTNPAGDMQMLKVRYSSVFGDSFVFSDVTGNRGTYRVKEHRAVIDMHMMTGRWDLRYYEPDRSVVIHHLDRIVAEVTLLPEYDMYFQIDLKDTSELLFVVGSLLAVSYFIR